MESLFSLPSIGAMLHGLVFGGGTLLTLTAALFALRATRGITDERPARAIGWLSAIGAAALWITVIGGTYISFPSYRVAPPDGATDLSDHPRALLLSSPDTAWLHSFGMEIKEHVPWMVAMLATAAAFIAFRYRGRLLTDARINTLASTLLVITVVLAAGAALLGVFINKVAPVY